MKKLLLSFLLLPAFMSAQNTGLDFDGNGDYIQTGFNGIAGSGSRSVQCWFKGGFSSSQRFFVDMGTLGAVSNGARFSFKINPSASVARIEIGGGGLDGSVNIRDGAWHQLTVTYDNNLTTNQYKIYVDGVLDVQGNISAGTLNTPATSASPMTIGVRTDISVATSTFLDGELDEVRVWNIALTPAQIAANWNKELCGTPTGLVAYYKMNEGIAGGNNSAITSLVDEITPASINTLTGFAKTGATSNYTAHTLTGGSSTSTISPSFCNRTYTSPTGKVFTVAGTYLDTIPAASGCDSIITIILSATGGTSSVSATACDSYTWTQNGMTYTASGTYRDTITVPGSCDSVITLNLTINSANAGTISSIAGVLRASGIGTSYQWLDCNTGNSPIAMATNQNFTPTANGSYACAVTTSTGCIDTTACFVYNSVGIQSWENQLTWKMFPNPATNVVAINLPEEIKSATLKVIDAQGKMVKEINLNQSVYTLDLSDLNNGLYQLVLISGAKSSTKALMVNK